ncbi:hypothetical protein [Falsiroseomonas sp. CW058]|uniref:hypothetical protein n=1 Tax=Falsiroseomonas sp. CW058 TaxID=3388664 RepID=UPI003D314DC5
MFRQWAFGIAAAGLLAPPAGAAIDPRLLREQSSLHLQVEVVSPARPSADPLGCTVEAVARRVFRADARTLDGRAAIPPTRPGDRMTIGFFCRQTSAPLRPGEAMPIGGPYVTPAEALAPGRFFELFLTPGREPDGPCGLALGVSAGSWSTSLPFHEVPAGGTPQPAIEARVQRQPVQPSPFVIGTPRRDGAPPVFPTRDVVTTYTVSNRPGETFRAQYSHCEQAVRFESLDRNGQPADGALIQARHSVSFRRFDQGRRIVHDRHDPANRFGRLVTDYDRARFTREGEATIAGLPCTRWHVVDEIHLPAGAVRRVESHACVTEDGLVLRREADGVVTEITSVAFRAVEPALLRAPQDYAVQRPQ